MKQTNKRWYEYLKGRDEELEKKREGGMKKCEKTERRTAREKEGNK